MLTIMQLIKILITLLDELAIEGSKGQARILFERHKANTYVGPIDENQILKLNQTLFATAMPISHPPVAI